MTVLDALKIGYFRVVFLVSLGSSCPVEAAQRDKAREPYTLLIDALAAPHGSHLNASGKLFLAGVVLGRERVRLIYDETIWLLLG